MTTNTGGPAFGEWLPIESAPKDGSSILVATINRDVCTARWSHRKQAWMIAYDKHLCATNYAKAVHWMPLPPPPKDAP